MPYAASEAHGKTHKANTDSRSRQWAAVYESSRARGDDESTAHAKASGVVKKNWRKSNPSGRKPRDYRSDEMKTAELEGFLKAAGVQRMRRLVAARQKGKPVAAALERASDKVTRRGRRYSRDILSDGEMSVARAMHSSHPLSPESNLASYEAKTRKHWRKAP